MNTKICSKCKTEKPLEEFYKRASLLDGHARHCKVCADGTVTASKAKNPEKYLTDKHEYNQRNLESQNEFKRDWAASNPEKIAAANKKYADRISKEKRREKGKHILEKLAIEAEILKIQAETLLLEETEKLEAFSKYMEIGLKVCRCCNLEKSFQEYNKDRVHSKDGLQKDCRDCRNEKKRGWHASNPEAKRECDKKSYIKNIDKRKITSKAYREDHKEEKALADKIWAENNRDKTRITKKKWADNNPEKLNAQHAARRANKLMAKPSWANDFFIEEAYRLARLRTEMTGFIWHVDHMVPLNSDKVCGLHCEDNLQVIPASENLAKSNSFWPNMWKD